MSVYIPRCLFFVLLVLFPKIGAATALDWTFFVQKTVEDVRINQQCVIRVSGTSGISSKSVGKIEVVLEKNEARIIVNVAPGVQGGSGTFQVFIPRTFPRVTQVKFGNSEEIGRAHV